jgi:hypothetical protein
MRFLGGRAGRCGGGTDDGRGSSSSKPRSKVFNRFPHDMQSDHPSLNPKGNHSSGHPGPISASLFVFQYVRLQ